MITTQLKHPKVTKNLTNLPMKFCELLSWFTQYRNKWKRLFCEFAILFVLKLNWNGWLHFGLPTTIIYNLIQLLFNRSALWKWLIRPHIQISSTYLRAAFTRADPKSVRIQLSHQYFLRFWDLLVQKLLVEHWRNWHQRAEKQLRACKITFLSLISKEYGNKESVSQIWTSLT